MEKLLVFMVMLASCYADTQDLSGKAFVFQSRTATDHVKLMTPKTSLSALTVCLRFKTDLTRNYALFSVATPAHTNDFLLFKNTEEGDMKVHVRDAGADFMALSVPPNAWHTVCTTWNSEDGTSQLWVDGKPTIKKFIYSGQPISGKPSTVLGQDQDSYGGGFDASQSFVGTISRVHMWDYVLSPKEIHRYEQDTCFTPGNVFNWKALDYEVVGNILVEPEVM
ncbi:serum amyloid P-component-like isoform X2 [Hippocampus zosterae]|uniref:serum amyloid P-component-like isoform X1 n=1 Tax=Hippocampus zosterae TaxID=109293 RepID=UPI00223D3BD4|nr:serum amyloid P-component-like isoform X1 [Hippocampus zosterae]XP_051922774.1 serum amyloid P-component-like isoform X2 [Hippocampus zosterae]